MDALRGGALLVARQLGPHLVTYSPLWPAEFERAARSIRDALGPAALLVEHMGSTSVPGLAAKPIIDITLAVPDSAQEAAYVPALRQAGFRLRVREPHWFEHRVFRGQDPVSNLHVYSAGCPEIDRVLLFRDRLRANPSERELYEQTKRRLAAQRWDFVQNYADAKTAVVEGIIARAQAEASTVPDASFHQRVTPDPSTGERRHPLR
jgi:GrpB-like predicted nucleotidyltransferase (UPF0157 family)